MRACTTISHAFCTKLETTSWSFWASLTVPAAEVPAADITRCVTAVEAADDCRSCLPSTALTRARRAKPPSLLLLHNPGHYSQTARDGLARGPRCMYA